MSYRFVHAGAFFGPDAEDAMSELVRAQFRAVLEDGDESATSFREWCERSAAELHTGADTLGFELWHVFEAQSATPRFTLLYYPDADSGLLFHAGTADPVGLALWPEGFEPKPPERVVSGVDLVALTRAMHSR